MQLLDAYGREAQYKRGTDIREVVRILNREARSAAAASKHPYRTNVWIYSVVTQIATALADIPFGLWRPARGSAQSKFSSKTWVPVEDPALSPKIEMPNRWQDRRRFIEQWAVFLLLGGNVWMYKDSPDSTGAPRAFLLFGTNDVAPVRDKWGEPPRAWALRVPNGETIPIPLEDMVHWALPNDYDQWIGLPPWYCMDEQLDADSARVAFDKNFFENNATPDLVLTHKPGPINRKTRELIEEAWQDSYGGTGGSSVAVVGGDFDVKVLGLGHAQAEYISSRKFTRQEAAAVYGFPVQLLNDIEGGGLGRDQLSVARQIKYENAVFPHAARYSEKFTNEVVKVYSRMRNVEAFFNYDPLPVMIDFLETKSNILTKLTSVGVPLNQAMSLLDFGTDPIEGGDDGLVPSSVVKIADAGEMQKQQALLPPPGQEEPGGDEEGDEEDGEEEKKKESPRKQVATGRVQGPDKWDDLVDTAGPLIVNAASKIKRFLFKLRNLSFRNIEKEAPFNLEIESRKWREMIAPFHRAAALLADDLVNRRQPWTKTSEDLDEIIDYLHNYNDGGAQKSELTVALDKQAERSMEIVRRLHEEILSVQPTNREQRVKESFEAVYEVARILATQEVVWAINAAIFNSRKVKKYYTSRYGCKRLHVGDFPGDGNQPLHLVTGCWCILRPDTEDTNEQKRS